MNCSLNQFIYMGDVMNYEDGVEETSLLHPADIAYKQFPLKFSEKLVVLNGHQFLLTVFLSQNSLVCI